jgi:hypothetical protein
MTSGYPPPGPNPGGYQPQPQYPGYTPPPQNGLGVAALVLGILALLSSFTVFGGIGLGIIAVILGIVGRGRVQRGQANNRGVATSGIVLGALGVVASVVFIAAGVAIFSWFGGNDLVNCLNKAGNDVQAQQQCQDQFDKHVDQKLSITPTDTPTDAP